VDVRAAAASALGRYVYLGEVEDLAESQARRVEEALLAVINGPDELEVRRRALEAVAFSSRPEVPPLIAAAYAAPEQKLRVSAVFAMGRNADGKRWGRPVRAELESAEPEMRFEAARAAGELELSEAGPQLAALVEDVDTQVQEAAIWSLGQIGGEFARRTLERLLERSEDEDEQEYIQEALDNLEFTDEVHAFSMFDFDGDGDSPDGAVELMLDELDDEDEDEEDEDFEALDDLDDLDALDADEDEDED
jgi:HEAT repeat protein